MDIITKKEDLLKYIIHTMERVENFTKLTWIEQKVEVTRIISVILHQHIVDDKIRKTYEAMIPIMIESVIVLSRHKLLINKVKSKFRCFGK